MSTRDLQIRNLEKDLRELEKRYEEHPDKANLRRIMGVKRELRELKQGHWKNPMGMHQWDKHRGAQCGKCGLNREGSPGNMRYWRPGDGSNFGKKNPKNRPGKCPGHGYYHGPYSRKVENPMRRRRARRRNPIHSGEFFLFALGTAAGVVGLITYQNYIAPRLLMPPAGA